MAKSANAESAQKLTWKEATNLVHKLYADGKFKYSAFVAMSIYLGLRYSDTSRITWHEIISLQPGEEFSTIETKTGKEARRPMVGELLDHIAKCYHSLGSKVNRHQPIIKTNSKTLVKAASLQAMNKIAKNWHDLYDIRGARKSNFSMHSFRKTAAWKYYTATGNNLIATMNFLNHSSPDVTKRYLRLDQQEMRDNYLKAFGNKPGHIYTEVETIKGAVETPVPKAEIPRHLVDAETGEFNQSPKRIPRYLKCSNCGTLHRNLKKIRESTCSSCGQPSPWLETGPEGKPIYYDARGYQVSQQIPEESYRKFADLIEKMQGEME